MDTILKVIESVAQYDRQDKSCPHCKLVKYIINSLNENQEKSKDWLVEKSKKYFDFYNNPSIVVAAGWYGHLASKLRKYTKGKVVSFDRELMCKKIGQKLYEGEGISFEFNHVETFEYKKFDIVVCTSCEHLEQKVIDDMLQKCKGKLLILQSNNYFYDPKNEQHVQYRLPKEHINCHNSLEEFEKSLKLEKVLFKDTLQCDKFDRYMVIGTK